MAAEMDSDVKRSRAMRLAGLSGAFFRILKVLVLLVTTPILVTSLGESAFGVFVTITALSSYLALSDLGIGAGLLTVLAKASEEDNQRRVAAIVTNAAWMLLGAGVAVALLGLVASVLVDIPRLFGAPPSLAASSIRGFQVFVIGFGLQIPLSLGARVQAALQSGAEAAMWLAAVTSFSAIASAVAAWWTGSMVMTVLASVSISCLILLLQSIRVARKYSRLICIRSFGFDASASRGLFASSGWLFLLQVSAVVAFQTDVIVVAAVLGSEDAAVFNGALRVFSLLSLVTTALAAQFWPASAAAFSSGGEAWVRDTHRRLAWQLPLLTAVAGLLLTVFGQTIILRWLGPSLVPPVSLLVAFALWSTYASFVLPFSQLLNGAGILKPQVFIGACMAVTNLGATLYLTTRIGLPGPPIGSLLAHVLVALVPTLILTRRVLRRAP